MKIERMKRVIKLTESQLEQIVRRVIEETYSGVAFGGEQNGLKIKKEETKEQTTPQPVSSQKQQLLQKFTAMFPPKTWYNQARTQNKVNATDPNWVKLYNIYRKYVDKTVPDMAANQGSDFFDWIQSKGGLSKVRDNINWVASIHTGAEPILMASNYPSTIRYNEALTNALKVNPNLNQNFIISKNLPTLETVYNDVTRNA